MNSLAHLLSYNLDKDSYNTNLLKELNAVSEYVRLQKVRYQFDFMIKILPEGSQNEDQKNGTIIMIPNK